MSYTNMEYATPKDYKSKQSNPDGIMETQPLQTILLDRNPLEWDQLLPQLKWAFQSIPHNGTKETANFLMLGR